MKVSLIIITYNSAKYIPELFASIRRQTIFDQLEVVIVDNASKDETVKMCRDLSVSWNQHIVLEPLAKNLGYPLAGNLGVERSTGEFVFILNADIWLETDCTEQLIQAMQLAKADAAVPSIAELRSQKSVPAATLGFDLSGRPTWAETDYARNPQSGPWHRCFMVVAPGFMFRREVWLKLGGFDAELFMYAEDDDISWKLWLAGYQGIHVTNAVLHHRSSAEDGVWEVRDFTRYLVNRNTLVVVAKNAQHVLLLCLPVQLLLLLAEGLVFLVARRSWRFVWKCYIKAPLDAFKMWRHVLAMRRRNRQLRCRSDWEMARMFLKFRINRWDMLKSMLRGQRSLVKPTV